MIHFVLLPTDFFVWTLIAAATGFVLYARRLTHWRLPWRQVMRSRIAKISLAVLLAFLCIGTLDSIHFQQPEKPQVESVLDVLLSPINHQEITYSKPWAAHSFIKVAGAYPKLQHFHWLGTDKVGQDVLYQTLKSVRTGLVIGTVTTMIMLPFAILLGIAAGFFGGRVDDLIQYLYTTLSSIPGVLLIAASILSLQVFMSQHETWFGNLAIRADVRLLALCVVLGITSWTGLCRLLRAETLKLREVEYVMAARALGASAWRIITQHILPNVMHIVFIIVVLDFSGLVLAEAVLSYVGVGVDPTTFSWGNMINSARLELARDPIVWWPLTAAFIFMFALVLAANLFADKLRDAFDPHYNPGHG